MKKKVIILFTLYFLITTSLLYSYQDKKEVRLNFWPFFIYFKNKKDNTNIIKILGPVFYEFSSRIEKIFSIRPFFSYVKTPASTELYFLSPLGKYRKTFSSSIFYLIPLLETKTNQLHNKKTETLNEFFLIFWGKTWDNQTFGGFFPFFGNFKNRFGTQKIEFFLWPVYTKVDYQDHYTVSYLWPFVKILYTIKYYYQVSSKPLTIILLDCSYFSNKIYEFLP